MPWVGQNGCPTLGNPPKNMFFAILSKGKHVRQKLFLKLVLHFGKIVGKHGGGSGGRSPPGFFGPWTSRMVFLRLWNGGRSINSNPLKTSHHDTQHILHQKRLTMTHNTFTKNVSPRHTTHQNISPQLTTYHIFLFGHVSMHFWYIKYYKTSKNINFDWFIPKKCPIRHLCDSLAQDFGSSEVVSYALKKKNIYQIIALHPPPPIQKNRLKNDWWGKIWQV